MTAIPTTLPNANGRNKRPSLSDQINRLDKTLDGLADGLNGAVADAVKDAVGSAVKEAVQTVLVEVLTNPTIRAKLTASVAPPPDDPPPPPQKPTFRQRVGNFMQGVRGYIASVGQACGAAVDKIQSSARKACHSMVAKVRSLWSYAQVLGYFKMPILIALSVSVLAGAGVWYAGSSLTALLSGIASFFAALTLQAWLWLRSVLALQVESRD